MKNAIDSAFLKHYAAYRAESYCPKMSQYWASLNVNQMESRKFRDLLFLEYLRLRALGDTPKEATEGAIFLAGSQQSSYTRILQ